ncbi:hypothetical protein BCO18175_06764 [Burkholderia contaminans]|nr:hypothetical protein BCO18175_06764 [Burkholderia contaminans]
MGAAALPAGHRHAVARGRRPDRAAREARHVARYAAPGPARRRARAGRRRARRAAGPVAHALPRRPARAARHARHAARDGRHAEGHRRCARKRDRSRCDPRIADRAGEGPRVRIRHVDRRCRDVRDARAAVRARAPRADRRGPAARREDRDDAARAFVRAPARRIVPAAAAPGRRHAGTGRPAADNDDDARSAQRRAARSPDRKPAGVFRPDRARICGPRVECRRRAEGKRRRKRARGRCRAAAGRRRDDDRARAGDGCAARHRDGRRAASARRADGRLREDHRQRDGRLEPRARRTAPRGRCRRAAAADDARPVHRHVLAAFGGPARRCGDAPRID